MKRRLAIAVAGFAVLAGGALLFMRPKPSAPQPIRFAGYTNGVVGTVTPVFSRLTTNNAATIQRWLAAGTNGAEFTITNQQSCAIWLFPFGRICTDESKPMRDETPLLNAPNMSGMRVPPSQAATVQVAVLPHQAPWRLQLYYHRDSCSDSFLNNFRMLLESLRARAIGKPARMPMHTIESELIER
jgi:hypothetical protein